MHKKRYSSEELQNIFNQHELWLQKKPGGKKAIFHNIDLSNYTDETFQDVELERAEFNYCDFSESRFIRTDFNNANLQYNTFRNAYFSSAFLDNANLSYSRCINTNFNDVMMFDADLSNCDLQFAHFQHCDLDYSKMLDVNIISAKFIICHMDGTQLPIEPSCINHNPKESENDICGELHCQYNAQYFIELMEDNP